MGIKGIPQEVFVIGCTHVSNATAFFCHQNDGTEPPDLWINNFPTKGRMIMTHNTICLACWACRESLDAIVKEYMWSTRKSLDAIVKECNDDCGKTVD